VTEWHIWQRCPKITAPVAASCAVAGAAAAAAMTASARAKNLSFISSFFAGTLASSRRASGSAI
jgi:hypothetical protein